MSEGSTAVCGSGFFGASGVRMLAANDRQLDFSAALKRHPASLDCQRRLQATTGTRAHWPH